MSADQSGRARLFAARAEATARFRRKAEADAERAEAMLLPGRRAELAAERARQAETAEERNRERRAAVAARDAASADFRARQAEFDRRVFEAKELATAAERDRDHAILDGRIADAVDAESRRTAALGLVPFIEKVRGRAVPTRFPSVNPAGLV